MVNLFRPTVIKVAGFSKYSRMLQTLLFSSLFQQMVNAEYAGTPG